ncbi:MAG: HAMP domain-containing histidine kinase [Kofleriaceae bacterium]|nr:HAMP domain-containing histidine kinase [Kofleriaceae bacterium]
MRPRPTILVKLLAAFAAPTLALFALFAYVAWQVTRDDLDAELGHRLQAVAAAAATQLNGKYLVKLEAGNEQDTRRLQAQAKLAEIAEATGARLYVFDPGFGSRLDTGRDVPIGWHYYTAELDRVEIGRVFARGVAIASVTFEGEDGRRYKAGYAPLYGGDGEVVLVVGAEAPAAYFDRLDDLRGSLLWWGAGLVVVVLAASFGVAFLITRPVRRLAAAAERIGRGDLDAPVVERRGGRPRDELGVLAETMDRMRAQLRDRDARMQQMLAGIAHEVRNPLAGMTLFTGILQDELADDERRGHADRIARELGYLERVVSEFLDYARRPAPEIGDVAVRALLAEVAELVAADAERGAVAVAIDVAAPAPALRGDAAQLRRAVLNLARNAVHAAAAGVAAGTVAAADGPAVRLVARRDGDDVVIDVVNRGPAIPADALDHIFDPFFTTREKGTGLGLAFVREIVHDHDGRVDVTSEGGETRFRVTLPARGPAPPPPPR